jgi:hypothetical protein
MTLEELAETLPNGLHDARIKSLTHDYQEATVKLEVEILVGMPDDPPPDRFRYRQGNILFRQVLFCAIETPENERILGHPASIWFKFWRMEPGVLPEKIAKSLPQESLCYCLYILEWESQIHIAAGDVSFSWSDTGEVPAAQL